MTEDKNILLQSLPKVDRLLEDERIMRLIQHHPRSLVVEKIRDHLENMRRNILDNLIQKQSLDFDDLVDEFVEKAEIELDIGSKRAVNGVGIVLHTGLGRAPLAETAQKALMEAVAHYSTLQIDRETGKRGDRYAKIEELLRIITGAEAALIVNNNAAATLLILNTLAGNKEVIVSRGELLEIGGSFRIPDVMHRSGAKLIEVGTTNRTHLKDYMNAITDKTGLILKVHQSNYRITGFTKQVPIEELAELAHKYDLPAVDDLGSGALLDLSRWGLPKEPTVQDSIKAAADVVCFSGDKLLGGPQCGIILGKKGPIEKIKKNQLTRALRCGKMTYAVLEATLRLFLDEETLMRVHPVLRMLTEPKTEIKKRCYSLRRKLKEIIGEKGSLAVEEDVSEVGSGSLAGETLPTWILSVRLRDHTPEKLARRLRMADPPVFSRIKDDKVILDCRTIRRDEFIWIANGFRNSLGVPATEQKQEAVKLKDMSPMAEEISAEVREIDSTDDDEMTIPGDGDK